MKCFGKWYQNNIIYNGLQHARLHKMGFTHDAIDLSSNTTLIPEDHIVGTARPKNPKDHAIIASFDRDRPIEFELTDLRNHIALEQTIKWNSKSSKWVKMSASDRQPINKILAKLTVLENDVRLSFLMRPNSELNLKSVLRQFFADDKAIKIIDISGTPGDVADSIIGCVGRLLYQYKVNQSLVQKQSDPVLVVCEEAHRYLPNSGKAEHRQAQHSIRTIAKEGRKYGLSLLAVSQRPSDVEPTVLSQCGTWIILRLTNAADQAHVGSLLPDTLSGLTKILPSLGRAEALFVGEAAAIPSRITINNLTEGQRPESNDMDFYQGWCSGGLAEDDLNELIKRWQNKPEVVESTDEPDDIPF